MWSIERVWHSIYVLGLVGAFVGLLVWPAPFRGDTGHRLYEAEREFIDVDLTWDALFLQEDPERTVEERAALTPVAAVKELRRGLRRTAPTDRSVGAINDLFRNIDDWLGCAATLPTDADELDCQNAAISVEVRARGDQFAERAEGVSTPESAREYKVRIQDIDGRWTEWVVNGWTWTFKGGDTRKWLNAAGWGSMCRDLDDAAALLLDRDEESTIGRWAEVEAEICRRIMEGRTINPEAEAYR